MKKFVFTIIIALIIHTSFSQTNTSQTKLDSISAIVIHYMQVKQADRIYALAGENFKNHLTQENFKSISEQQVFPLNDFQHISSISTANGINKYKVADTADLQLFIGLDKDDKLETSLIQPFSNN